MTFLYSIIEWYLVGSFTTLVLIAIFNRTLGKNSSRSYSVGYDDSLIFIAYSWMGVIIMIISYLSDETTKVSKILKYILKQK